MTNEQKLQIKHLREPGYGYISIAESLYFTEFQVSSYRAILYPCFAR